MPHISCRLLVVGIVLVSGAGALRAEESVLRWRFEKGQSFKYLLKHREVRKTEVGTLQSEITTTSEYEWEFKVKEVDDKGIATLEKKLTALKVSIASKDLDFSYDSSQPQRSDDDYKKKLITLYDQLRFTTFKLRLGADGRVAAVEGYDKLLDEIAANIATVMDYQGFYLHDGSWQWFLQQLLPPLPKDKVSEGSKWNDKLELKISKVGQANGETGYLCDKPIKDGKNLIQPLTLKGTHSLELDMTWLNNPMKGVLKTSKCAGQAQFDVTTGRVRQSELQCSMQGDLKLGSAVLKTAIEHHLKLELQP